MKKIILLGFALSLLSCSDKEESTEFQVEQLFAKWELTDNSVTSVEFNKSMTYILVTNINGEEDTEYGNYTVSNNNVSLEGDGQLNDILINNNQIEFTLVKDNQELEISGIKKEERILSNSSTASLFKTWNLVLENGEPVIGTSEETHVFISMAETYFVASPNNSSDNFMSYWNWKNIDDEIFCYSHSGPTDCDDDDNLVNIIKLTETELIIEDVDLDDIFTLEAL